MFDGGQVTVYDANGNALVSQTITTGTNRTRTFTLPTALTVAKGAPVNLTVKLDQVSNAVSTSGKYLQLAFNTVVAKEIINYNYVGASVTANGTQLISVTGGTPSIVSQSYTANLVKYGTESIIGNVKFKATNAGVTLNDIYFTLSGLSVANLSNVSAKLYEDGVYVLDLNKSTTLPVFYATNINKSIELGTGKTYEVKATFNTINTNADVLPTFTTVLGTGTFTSTYGTTITPSLTGVISSTNKMVNEIPTVTAIDGYVKGNDVVYKLTLNSTKEVNLSGLKVSVNGTNTSGAFGTIYLAPSDLNYLTTNYATATVGANSGVFVGLAQGAVTIQGSKVLYVVLKDAALMANTNGNTSTVRISATNMDYMDVFADNNSIVVNTDMLLNYQTSIAGTLDLLKVVSIQ